METKANYVAVGAFVLACMLSFVVALVWLAGTQYSEEYNYYRTYFSGSVTGLGKGTSVRFNGIEVGRISNLDFDPENPKRVIVTMQVDPKLHLHEDSIATIASQGLTGGSYVEIEGGSKNSPMLTRKRDEKYPIIKSKPSTLQQLAESAPRLIAKFNHVADRLAVVLDDQNVEAFSEILNHVNNTASVVDRHSKDLDETFTNLNRSSKALEANLKHFDVVLGHTDHAVRGADRFINGDTFAQFTQLVVEARELVTSLKRLSNDLDREPTKVLFGDRHEGYTPK